MKNFYKLLCKIIIFSALFMLFGCVTNPYTNQPWELEDEVLAHSRAAYKKNIAEWKRKDILVTDTEFGQYVVSVGNDIIAAAKQWERVNTTGKKYFFTHNYAWEINIVDLPIRNAWCMAGGKICIYTGYFNVLKNTDELASTFAHEVAHALLFHIKREKDNNKYMKELNINNALPYSRAMETEADKLGLTLMILAGYNGDAMAEKWERQARTRDSKDEYASTHPADWRRAENLRKEIPKSQKIAQKIKQGKKAVQYIAPTMSLGLGVMTGVQPTVARKHNPVDTFTVSNLFKAFGSDIFYGAGLKASFETTLVGLSFSMPNGMQDWLGSAYLKYNFRFGTSADNILSPFGGIEFSNGYFGGIFGANIDKKLIDRFYLRGQLGWRVFNYNGNTSSIVKNGLPLFVLGTQVIYAIK